MNLRLIGLLAVLLFLFFLVVAGELVMSASRKSSYEDLKEPPVAAQAILNEAEAAKANYRPHQGFTLGSSAVEGRWKAALDSELERDRISKERRQGRDDARDFLKTRAGEYFTEGLNLLKANRREEAREYLMKALDSHVEYDYGTYMVLIKTILRTYIRAEDLKSVDEAVLRYLDVIRTQHTAEQYQRAASEMIQRIEEKIRSGG
ncbi:MAG: hypothetical protein H3C47_05140 [Candidatus Cloacimonetes bacterium]|nr:hypothetical protein [Candidatus Cloacimonadota bacterium]